MLNKRMSTSNPSRARGTAKKVAGIAKLLKIQGPWHKQVTPHRFHLSQAYPHPHPRSVSWLKPLTFTRAVGWFNSFKVLLRAVVAPLALAYSDITGWSHRPRLNLHVDVKLIWQPGPIGCSLALNFRDILMILGTTTQEIYEFVATGEAVLTINYLYLPSYWVVLLLVARDHM